MICKGCSCWCKSLINNDCYRFGHGFNDLDAKFNDQGEVCASLVRQGLRAAFVIKTFFQNWKNQKPCSSYTKWANNNNKLMRQYKDIPAKLVEFQCEKCNQGVYRVAHSATPSCNQWRHICRNCQHEVFLGLPYPFIEYKGEKFVLEKHIPRQSPNPLSKK